MEDKQAMTELESEDEGFVHSFRSIIRQLVHIFDHAHKVGHTRKTQLFWARIGHKQTPCRFYGMDWTRILFYQRLIRGLSVFMKNSG